MLQAPRRTPQARLWILLVLAPLNACGQNEPGRIKLGRPPVVIILLDALHAGHISHLGYERETTPNLDALAAEGITFTQAFAPAPYTLASISSILTGKLPDRHGLVDNRSTLGAEEVTFAELLAQAGYRTCAAVGNLNGSSSFACEQGFEEYVEVFLPEDGRSVDLAAGEVRFHMAKALDYPPLTERFLAGDDGRPMLLYLHIIEPHEPYSPPDAFRERFLEQDYRGPFAEGDSKSLRQGRKGELPFGPDDKRALEALYDANLAHVDEVVGQILSQLDRAGVLDEALIVVTSDHGEAFWQHQEQGHNTTLYDEMLHVPLILRFPRQTDAPRVLRPGGLVTPMDLLPSLCEWLDLPLPASDLDGVSLSNEILGAADLSRQLILRSHHEPPWLGIRSASHKTIIKLERERGEPQVEHYWLPEDPGEQVNLGGEDHERAQADARELRAFAEQNVRRDQSNRRAPLSRAERALLRDLGYTDD